MARRLGRLPRPAARLQRLHGRSSARPAALLTGALGGHRDDGPTASPPCPACSRSPALGVALAGPVTRGRQPRLAARSSCSARAAALALQALAVRPPGGPARDRRARSAPCSPPAAAARGWAVGAARRSPWSRSSGRCWRSLPAALAAPRGGLRIAVARRRRRPPLLLGAADAARRPAAHGGITTHRPPLPPPPGLLAVRHPGHAGVHRRRPRHADGPGVAAAAHPPADRGRAGSPSPLAWWLRSGPERNRDDVLGVLALAFLLRCMLDPWNLVYYHLPLVVALAAWEARRGRDLPVLALVATAACWLTFVVYDERAGYGPYLAYLAWARAARRRPRRRALAAGRARRGARARPPQLAPDAGLTRQLRCARPMSRRSDQRRAAVFALYQHELTGRALDDVFERDAAPSRARSRTRRPTTRRSSTPSSPATRRAGRWTASRRSSGRSCASRCSRCSIPTSSRATARSRPRARSARRSRPPRSSAPPRRPASSTASSAAALRAVRENGAQHA